MNRTIPTDLKKKFEDIFSNVDFDQIEEDFENKSVMEAWLNFLNELFVIFQSKEGLIASLEAFKHGILNFEKNLIKTDIVNKDLFLEVKDGVTKALEKDPSKVKEIYLDYKNSFKLKYPIEKLTESVLFYQDFLPELLELALNTTLIDYSEKVNKLFIKKLDECNEEDFMRYVFDWLLKFGYLIEGYLVDILRAELKLHYLLNGINYKNKKIKKMTFFQLLNELKEDHTFRKYRNAIFHPDFIIEYQVDSDERKIIFPSLEEGKKELLIKELINYFFMLIQVVQSYRFAFTYAVPLNMREDGQKPLIDMLDGWIKDLENVEFIPTQKEDTK